MPEESKDYFESVLMPSLKDGIDVDFIKTGFDEYINKKGEEFSSGLRKNRDEILAEKKEIAKRYEEFQDRYSFLEGKEITPESYNKLLSDLDTYKASASKSDEELSQRLSDQFEKGKKSYEELMTPKFNSLEMKLKEAEQLRDGYQDRYRNYLKDNVLRRSLSKMNAEFDDFWFEGFKASSKVDYDDEGNIKMVSIKHDGGYLPLEDWERLFPNTDRGKKMIKVAPNSGGGSPGSGFGVKGATTLDEINKIEDPNVRRAELAKFMKK
jgi:hypothetical protein